MVVLLEVEVEDELVEVLLEEEERLLVVLVVERVVVEAWVVVEVDEEGRDEVVEIDVLLEVLPAELFRLDTCADVVDDELLDVVVSP